MNEKQKLIRQMIEMQKKFIAKQRQSGISSQEYYLPGEDDELSGYGNEYNEMAARLVDLAHGEQGTSR